MNDELIPEGYYQAKPTASGFITTRNDHAQYAIECEITEGDHAGRRLTKFQGVESDEGMEYAIRDLRTCGWTGTDVVKAEVDPNVVVRIRVVHEHYNGETKAKLKSIFPLDGAPGLLIQKQAMDDKRKREIAARMNAFVGAVDASAGKPRASNGAKPKAARGPEFDHSTKQDDDIPF